MTQFIVESIDELVDAAMSAWTRTGTYERMAAKGTADKKPMYSRLVHGIDRLHGFEGGIGLGFGVHAGNAWHDLPEDYRLWVIEEAKNILAARKLTDDGFGFLVHKK